MPYRTIYHNRGVEMPNYYKTTEGSITLELKPKGVFRNLFKKWLPYLTGDNLDLELKVTSSLDTDEQCSYHWLLYDFGTDKNKRIVEQRNGSIVIKSNDVTFEHLKNHLILYESEYHMDVQCKTQQHTLLSFYAMSRDVYRAKWSTALMSGFIGGILGVVVGFLLASLGNGKP